MDRESQKVYEALAAWPGKYPTFSKRKWGINQPKSLPGERFFYRIPFCAYQADAEELVGASRSPIGYLADLHKRKGTYGVVFVTDQRVFVAGNFGKIIHEWRFAELTDVEVLPAWMGVHFVSAEADDAFVYLFPPAAEALSGPDLAEKLLTVEATFVLSAGRDYEAWLAELKTRLATELTD